MGSNHFSSVVDHDDLVQETFLFSEKWLLWLFDVIPRAEWETVHLCSTQPIPSAAVG